MIKTKKSCLPILVIIAVSSLLYLGTFAPASAAPPSGITSKGVIEKIRNEGRARVLVKLQMPRAFRNEVGLSRSSKQRQRAEIATLQRRVKDRLQNSGHRVWHEYKSIPFIALEIDYTALARLEAAGVEVASIYEDRLAEPFLAESIPQIEADLSQQAGLNGSGAVVAIIDSGVDSSHSFLAGRVIDEACYASSETGSGGDCPNGQASQEGNGAGGPCTFAPFTCRHGTHVAGIAAGSGSSFTGVAPAADLISIQVFHASYECSLFEEVPCARAFESDLVAALERVYELRDQHAIAAVNMSLGAGAYDSVCDADYPAMAIAIDNLKAAGIATVASSGNSGLAIGIASPACISSAVSVAAVDETNQVAFFSNASQDLNLYAPGTTIQSSVPGNGFDTLDGTSMAAPHVAGAWAVMQQANPAASVDDNLALLQTTGRPVTDFREGANITRPLIRMGGVIGIESPLPVLSSTDPTTVPAGSTGQTITVSGADFVRSSVVLVDGLATPTTYVSDTELSAVLTAASFNTTESSLEIAVFSPAPGGGTSNSLQLDFVPPELTVDTTSVEAAQPVTVTLVNGPGNRWDWIALAAVGDPETVYIEYVYVSEWSSTASWTVNMPGVAGDYEFRLFADNGYSRLATSPAVTVTTSLPPPPDPELAVSATSVGGGDPVTVTLSHGPGNNLDWIALAVVGDPNETYLDTAYVPAGETSTTWTVNMPDAAGDYEFRLFADGGFDRVTTSPAVTVTATPAPAEPSLAVSATSVNGGDSVTVTLADGPGNNLDWIALAAVGDPDATYLETVYVPSGATTTTWTVNMPNAVGNYEFRLFADNGYTRIATSPTVAVTAPSAPSLTVSATSVEAGEAVTVMLDNGPGNNLDWIALAVVGDPDATYLDYVYVAAGETTASWTLNMPGTPGNYEFRLFADGGFTRVATSSTVAVTTSDPGPSGPTLAVSATTVDGGDAVTVTLSDGPGNNYDWIALATVGAPDTSYLQYIYVAPGATTASWTVSMPSTPGNYEFRLFADNGYTRVTTSPTVTVAAPAAATLAVSATAVETGDAVTVTLANGPGNNFDWIALAAVGAPDTSYLQSVYVASGSTTASWTVNMPSTPGDYEFRLFADNGYTRVATSPTVTVAAPAAATLTVSATAVEGGDAVTVTLANGPGNNFDWIALAAVGAADTSYLQSVYVASGSTTTSWTVNMPSTPGDYEFRLFADNGFTRLATSVAVTVTVTAPPPATLDVDATSVTGGDVVTVTLANGPGNNYDWIALATVGAPESSYVDYVYVPSGATTASWTVTMPATPGNYEFRLFADNGYTRISTSPTVVVNP